MPESALASSRARRALVRGAALVTVVIVLLSAVLVIRWAESEDPERTISSRQTTTSALPPSPAPPMTVTDRTVVTVPERTRFAESTFWAEADTTYLVTMDLESMKPEGSGGRSMYLGVTLSCSPQDGGLGISVGGTQNMLTGEMTTYRNQGIISVPEDGAIDCSIKASAPYDDVASNGTTFQIDASWRADPISGEVRASSEDGLPRTVAAEAEEAVMTVDLPLDQEAGDALRVISTLHLTTCTIVNGSREDDRAWCSEGELDVEGSTVSVTQRAELVDADGAVCEVLEMETTAPDHIDLYRHHRLISLEFVGAAPEAPCGSTVRLTVGVHNDGPAPVVVHRSNSSLIAASDAR